MESVIGIILSTGQTLDQILDMSWDQIMFCAQSIQKHKISMFEVIFDAISVGLGGKKSKKSKRRPISNKNKELSIEEKRKKESLLIHNIKASGFKI